MRKTASLLLLAWVALCAATAPMTARGGLSSPPDSPFIVESWSTDDGLPQSSVIAVLQARDGYLWLGTLNGLVRFDGVRFTVFDESNTPGLNSSRIVHLFEDSRRNLWVGTETAGVVLVQDGSVRELGIGRGSREGRLRAACEDLAGAVWLYTADGQLCRYQAGQVDVWNYGTDRPSQCRSLAVEPERLWVGTDWQLTAVGPLSAIQPPALPRELVLPVGRLDFLLQSRRGGYWRLANGRVQKCRGNTLERDFGEYPWRTNALVSAACEDTEGNLVVGTLDEISGDGVYWFDAEGRAMRVSKTEGLRADGVLSLCMDREGDLWVGTDGGGLSRVKRKVFQPAAGSINRVAQTACGDGTGGLWMGFTAGATFWHGDTVTHYGTAQGLVSKYEQNVSAVFVDREGQVWVGTGGGLFKLNGERFERVGGPAALRTAVTAIHQDRQGRLWFGTQAGLVGWNGNAWEWLTTREGLSSDLVRAIADDAEGNVWIGTTGGGLNRLRDGKFTAFRKQPEGLPGDDVSCLLVDREGVLWIGALGRGLVRFTDGKWTRYTTGEGLVSNSIGYLLEDDHGDLWLGSNAGLMRIPKRALNEFARGESTVIACRAYGKADGLPTREGTFGSQPAAGRTADGHLWFPTTLGLVGLNPAELKPNPVPPPVVIESVWVEGRLETSSALRMEQPVAATIRPRKGRLEIHYTSLNLAAPERARFQYRMAGYETGWTDAGNRRVAPYQKLAPGAYTFEVRACNEDGVWSSAPATLAITVLPPFWRTWWFMTVSALALLGAVVGTVHLVSTQKLKRQLRQQAALENERSRIARDLHDQLGANLTQVSLLGELVEADKGLPEEVEAHARQITNTSRETTRALDEIVWATNPANDTLEGLINYVCKYAQEYLALAGLRYRLDVPSPLPATPLLPEVRHNVFLAAKEAVNNVVKHAQASSAWVRLHLDTTQFTLEIQDDGRGVGEAAKTSTRNGLKNMRKRLQDVGGTFTIEAAPERGTIIRLAVPLANNAR
jgi:signal transduction histidine kinase/ligand-binding sensor domain-containing protein